ncbi:Cytochrome P450 714C2 isoform H, partial [Glycine soja]
MEMSTMQVVLGMVLVLLMHVFNVLVLRPRSLRAKLHRQGIHGPSPHFYFGNIPKMKTLLLQVQLAPTTQVNDKVQRVSLSHKWPFPLFPHIQKWINQYGKSTYLFKDPGPLLGQGILSSSGQILGSSEEDNCRELYLDKPMVNLIVDSINITLRSWEARLEIVINYIEEKEIFSKLRDLQKLLSKIHAGIPGYQYLPNKSNRQMWRLERKINSNISKLIKQRQEETHEQDLLQMILEGAKYCKGSDGLLSNSISHDRFVIDNYKIIFFAGHEIIAITESWCLMLLALHQDWQDRARAEVLEVCGIGALDAMQLTLVIQETLRLYSPQAHVVRTAFQDIILKGILVPKGMNIQIPVPLLNQYPQLPDVHKFNPERFANGVLGACKVPQAYNPFGIGPRVCLTTLSHGRTE